ncbi:hypothetical protein B0J18DRAFT_439254 [Chaetomium sp. MPI-SDFR-AT-0129]|nr:hypothetical protein B0J18DRAFT_439254 [Chaetomium sp. MPI-SDFR-AT-0129]
MPFPRSTSDIEAREFDFTLCYNYIGLVVKGHHPENADGIYKTRRPKFPTGRIISRRRINSNPRQIILLQSCPDLGIPWPGPALYLHPDSRNPASRSGPVSLVRLLELDYRISVELEMECQIYGYRGRGRIPKHGYAITVASALISGFLFPLSIPVIVVETHIFEGS